MLTRRKALLGAIATSAIGCTLTLTLLVSPAAAFTFTTIDVPGAQVTEAHGINKAGQIVGTYYDGTAFHGFLRQTDGTFTSFDAPGATTTDAYGINKAGQIVGFFYGAVPTAHGFLRNTDGTFVTIDVQGATETFAIGINKTGQISGHFKDGNGELHGFLRSTDGTINTFDVQGATQTRAFGINKRGQIVGSYMGLGPLGVYTPEHAFIGGIGPTIKFDYPGALLTQAQGINSSNVKTVGGYLDANGFHGFLLKTKGFTSIDVPGATQTTAFGISGKKIVGFYNDSNNVEHGFLATK